MYTKKKNINKINIEGPKPKYLPVTTYILSLENINYEMENLFTSTFVLQQKRKNHRKRDLFDLQFSTLSTNHKILQMHSALPLLTFQFQIFISNFIHPPSVVSLACCVFIVIALCIAFNSSSFSINGSFRSCEKRRQTFF